MKFCIALVIIVSTCAPALAEVGEIWVSPYSFTRHFGTSGYCPKNATRCDWAEWKKFENSHPSLSIEYLDSENKSVAAGVYHDSYGGTSVYFARHWRYRYGLGATMGVLVGERYPSGFVPFLGPEISIQIQSVKVSLAYLPGFGAPGTPNLGVLQVAVKIW